MVPGRTQRPRRPASRSTCLLLLITIFAAPTEVHAAPAAAHAPRLPPRAPGDELWTTLYQSLDIDQALDQALSPDGKVLYATGLSGPRFTWDYLTVAYLVGTGRQLWAVQYTGPVSGEDSARAVAVSPDGSTVFVTGESGSTGGSMDYATVAYRASTGEQLWAARYDGPAHTGDSALDVVVSGDGLRIFVTGGSTDQTYDWATIAYDAATGAQLWVARYDGSGTIGDWDYGNFLALSQDSSVLYVTGWAVGTSQENEFATIAYDTETGAQVWVSTFHTPGTLGDFAGGLASSADGRTLYVTGATGRSYSDDDWTTVALTAASGGVLWVARYAGPAKGFDDPFSLIASPRGSRLFVTGRSDDGIDGGDVNYVTIAYDASRGKQRWLAEYDGPDGDGDEPCCIGMGPRGATVYVTGFSAVRNGLEFATIAYDALTGGLVWVARSLPEGHLNALPHGLSVQPSGARVVVSGESYSYSTDLDFTTIAYQG